MQQFKTFSALSNLAHRLSSRDQHLMRSIYLSTDRALMATRCGREQLVLRQANRLLPLGH